MWPFFLGWLWSAFWAYKIIMMKGKETDENKEQQHEPNRQYDMNKIDNTNPYGDFGPQPKNPPKYPINYHI